ncbi:dienelactone hydrolase [Nocardia nova]|uniref:Dienelactone hydrolase n=2 Tax=Nocardia nova TaxID=37330 RepID=A0A2S6AKK1_9NOCA|nr:dienelactone hydrolase [Nocardia nova]PPJ35759.1 dienelactone hydrolase [Nocardia nova]
MITSLTYRPRCRILNRSHRARRAARRSEDRDRATGPPGGTGERFRHRPSPTAGSRGGRPQPTAVDVSAVSRRVSHGVLPGGPIFRLPRSAVPGRRRLDVGAARRPEIFQQVFPMIRDLTPELWRSDAGAYLNRLAASPKVTAGKAGVTGYCMGARLAVLTAGMFPDRIAAVAGFHGGPLVTDTADSPHRSVGNITGELYFAHAGEDDHMTPEHISVFDTALADAGVRHRTEVHEGAHHGFTQADTSAYDAEAAERHYRELLALFDRNVRR